MYRSYSETGLEEEWTSCSSFRERREKFTKTNRYVSSEEESSESFRTRRKANINYKVKAFYRTDDSPSDYSERELTDLESPKKSRETKQKQKKKIGNPTPLKSRPSDNSDSSSETIKYRMASDTDLDIRRTSLRSRRDLFDVEKHRRCKIIDHNYDFRETTSKSRKEFFDQGKKKKNQRCNTVRKDISRSKTDEFKYDNQKLSRNNDESECSLREGVERSGRDFYITEKGRRSRFSEGDYIKEFEGSRNERFGLERRTDRQEIDSDSDEREYAEKLQKELLIEKKKKKNRKSKDTNNQILRDSSKCRKEFKNERVKKNQNFVNDANVTESSSPLLVDDTKRRSRRHISNSDNTFKDESSKNHFEIFETRKLRKNHKFVSDSNVIETSSSSQQELLNEKRRRNRRRNSDINHSLRGSSLGQVEFFDIDRIRRDEKFVAEEEISENSTDSKKELYNERKMKIRDTSNNKKISRGSSNLQAGITETSRERKSRKSKNSTRNTEEVSRTRKNDRRSSYKSKKNSPKRCDTIFHDNETDNIRKGTSNDTEIKESHSQSKGGRMYTAERGKIKGVDDFEINEFEKLEKLSRLDQNKKNRKTKKNSRDNDFEPNVRGPVTRSRKDLYNKENKLIVDNRESNDHFNENSSRCTRSNVIETEKEKKTKKTTNNKKVSTLKETNREIDTESVTSAASVHELKKRFENKGYCKPTKATTLKKKDVRNIPYPLTH